MRRAQDSPSSSFAAAPGRSNALQPRRNSPRGRPRTRGRRRATLVFRVARQLERGAFACMAAEGPSPAITAASTGRAPVRTSGGPRRPGPGATGRLARGARPCAHSSRGPLLRPVSYSGVVSTCAGAHQVRPQHDTTLSGPRSAAVRSRSHGARYATPAWLAHVRGRRTRKCAGRGSVAIVSRGQNSAASTRMARGRAGIEMVECGECPAE
ncbi:hypothetical protein C2E23DRAFT_597541 [Lenzites betulinus]|nr:hypothetical protein C2E23DRAFT_597541 [Lenzites betulinus]